MKIFISADIEGITGTTHWDETEKAHADYAEFQEQMTAEVTAACEGALDAGAAEIWVKDAHASARNLIASRLPREVKLVRGWSGHPFMMMDGIDPSFNAAMMIGYHSRAGSNGSPLAHTMSGAPAYVKINDRYAPEFLINAYTAGLVKVPVVLVAGDAGVCADAASLIPAISQVAVKEGLGRSVINLHPLVAREKIREAAKQALKGDLLKCVPQLPERFSVEIRYKDHFKAFESSFFPGASLKDPFTIQFDTGDYMDVLKLIMFVV